MSAFPLPQSSCAVGPESVALGYNCQALGTQAVCIGVSNYNTGDASTAFGDGNTIADNYSLAVGQNNTTTTGTPFSIALGDSNTINDVGNPGFCGSAVAIGTNNTCSNYLAFAIGKDNVASGDTSFAMGTTCTASGPESLALGSGCTASGDNSFANGVNCQATAQSSSARGVYAKATIPGQDAFSSQRFAALAAGTSQTSVVTQVGSTPGDASGEGVELAGGGAVLELTDSRTYAVKYTVAVSGEDTDGDPFSRMFSQELVVRKRAGVSTIVASETQVSIGDAGAAAWTFTPTIGAGPDRIYFAFNTGATTMSTKVVARVELTEIAF